MKRILFIFTCLSLIFIARLLAQTNAGIPYGSAKIDGTIEKTWDLCAEQAINKPFGTETPTVTAYWKAMYDEDNFYVVINVNDDNHWPGWESGGNNWEYDKPEVY